MKKKIVSSYSKILIFNNTRIEEFTNYNIRRLSHFQSGMSAEQRNMVSNMQVSQRINWFYEWRKILPIKKNPQAISLEDNTRHVIGRVLH